MEVYKALEISIHFWNIYWSSIGQALIKTGRINCWTEGVVLLGGAPGNRGLLGVNFWFGSTNTHFSPLLLQMTGFTASPFFCFNPTSDLSATMLDFIMEMAERSWEIKCPDDLVKLKSAAWEILHGCTVWGDQNPWSFLFPPHSYSHTPSALRCNPTISGGQESDSFKSHKWLMELYFTAHCRSARGRLQSDMISHQSGERWRAMPVQRSQGMEREGKERESERPALHCHITSHAGAGDEKSNTHQIPDLTSFSFLLYVFPLSFYLCISFSLLHGMSYNLPLSVSVMRSLVHSCSHFFYFLCPYYSILFSAFPLYAFTASLHLLSGKVLRLLDKDVTGELYLLD